MLKKGDRVMVKNFQGGTVIDEGIAVLKECVAKTMPQSWRVEFEDEKGETYVRVVHEKNKVVKK